ncbi:hypothetical protein J2T58_001127 [Methanocalculus alkaliphilus]|uniref:hypothetical protein n=1 Tax=Methanocalculus alkaliphilus TaxID=768730 RepID=UPI0020A09EC4|nr:hypothetical protein [Methanocalculus alkaliphilus]MCP1715273.1 hypothetical protein [Methanocalculus alkaliphilus]
MGADARIIDLLRGGDPDAACEKAHCCCINDDKQEGAARRIGAVKFSGAVPPL